VLEFEDLRWFPSWLRTLMTNVIVVLSRKIGVIPVLATLVSRVLKQEGIDRIVDLGSGAGGAMPDVLASLRDDPDTSHVTLVMTDRYPNLDALRTFNDEGRGYLRYERQPVDATDLAAAPSGLKTMINCFHHMRPAQARAILESARANRQPLLIYEMAENKLPLLVWCMALPISLPLVALSVLFLTPFVRPLTPRQLLFTYVVPLVPIFYAWDGQASLPRTYSSKDIDELLDGLHSPEYRWEKGHAKKQDGRPLGTYLLGLPAR
jgi:hypothetical protein